MSDATPERPRQVTLAAWTIMVGSGIVLLLTFELIANLHTLQTRESVESFLGEPPGDGLGMSVESALVVVRTFAMVAAGCATAAGILGYQVLQRNKTARIVLTVLAVPLLVTGMVTGGFFSSLVAASAFLLWLPPARDWYEGRAPAKRDTQRWSSSDRSERSVETTEQNPAPGGEVSTELDPRLRERRVETTPGSEPRSVTGFGDRGATNAPASFWAPASTRPPSVVWASALTWLFSGLGSVLIAIALVYLAVNGDAVMADLRAQNPEIDESGLSDDALVATTIVLGLLVIAWAVGAIVMGVLFYKGVSWSRLVLLVSTGGALGLLALGALTQWVLVVPFLAAALTFSLLLRPESAAWVRRSARR